MADGKVILKDAGDGKRSSDGSDSSSPDIVQMDVEEMKVLVSGVLRHEGKTFVRVSFLRGKDWAEGIVPDGVIEKAEGFSPEEIGKLQEYLAGEKEMIIRQAKGINPIRNLFQL